MHLDVLRSARCLLSCLSILLATCPSPVLASNGNARAEIVFHTIFLTDEAQQWTDAPISKPVTAKTLLLIPEEDAKFSMIELRCDALRPDGILAKCKVSSDPSNDQINAVGQEAAKDIRIDPDFARSVQGKVRFISIQLRVSNSAIPVTTGPCWPPTCSFIPAPPPPPKPSNP